jgi:2-keto-4-pentenoate hydratase
LVRNLRGHRRRQVEITKLSNIQAAVRSKFVDSAANSLIDARNRSAGIEAFAGGLQPVSPDEAYAIQESVVRRAGGFGGWKIGQIDGNLPSVLAPILPGDILTSPANCPTSSFHLSGIEAEIALRLRHDLSPELALFSHSAVEDAIGSVHAAIEVVGSRFTDLQSMKSLAILATTSATVP